MRSAFYGILLLVAGCAGNPGKDFEQSTDAVYSRLRALDLGAPIDSATFMFDRSTTTSGNGSTEVIWRYKGKEILTASLTAKDEKLTNVALTMPELQSDIPGLGGLAQALMEERVFAHLERRPFDDKKIMDMMYAGSLVPAGIQAQALEAQREFARVRRELTDEDRERDDRHDAHEARRQMRDASAPTTDLSTYGR